jgi:hypothetical protein
MLCFRDMTFCHSNCVNAKCDRHFSEAEKEKARSWWKRIGGKPEDGPRVAFRDFSGECERYKPAEGE